MRIFHNFDCVDDIVRPAVTLGSFDGVHTGHRRILDSLIAESKRIGGQSVVITFDPHPRQVIFPDQKMELLTSLDEKAEVLERLGIDNLLVIKFDEDFRRLSSEEFVREYLVKRLGMKSMIVGYNHHFGHNKAGDHSFLVEHGALEVVEVAQYTDNGNKVSSTTIRKAVGEGDMALARQLLGHTYIIIGMADAEGRVATDKYKLLPADGRYDCTINGEMSVCEICGGVVVQKEFFLQDIEISL